MTIDQRRRLSFGSVAEQYDANRPSYPAQLVDDVIVYAGAREGDRTLDVGAGTGKALRLFAERGLDVVALEPSSEMAAVARRHAGGAVRIEITDFESAEVPEHAFKLVYSAQAWHWVDPARRYELAARALAQDGALALFWNNADWGRTELRHALLEAYDRSGAQLGEHGPMYPGGPTTLDRGADLIAEVGEAGGRFTDARAERYDWTRSYTAAEYVALVHTHSDHLILDPPVQAKLYEEITATIERNGGAFTLAYSTLLCMARRR